MKNSDTKSKDITGDLKDDILNNVCSLVTASKILKDLKKNVDYESAYFDDFLDNIVKSSEDLHKDLKSLLWSLEYENNNIELIANQFENLALNNSSKESDINIMFSSDIIPNQVLPSLWNFQVIQIFKACISNLTKFSSSKEILCGVKSSNTNFQMYFEYDDFDYDFNYAEQKNNFILLRKTASLGFNVNISQSKNHKKITIEGSI